MWTSKPVSQSKKEFAREEVINFFSNKKNNEFRCFVRVNSIKTYYGLKDLTAFIDNNCFPDGFVLPMVDSAEEVTLFESVVLPLLVTTEHTHTHTYARTSRPSR